MWETSEGFDCTTPFLSRMSVSKLAGTVNIIVSQLHPIFMKAFESRNFAFRPSMVSEAGDASTIPELGIDNDGMAFL